MSQLVAPDDIFIDRILDGTYDLWHDGLTRQAYGQFWRAQKATPWGRSRLTRWALTDQGNLLSSAKVYRFDAVLDGVPLQIAGLGAVFTPPPMRGRGAAADLIQQICDRQASEGSDAALLFSEIGSDYYARLGFATLPLDDLSLRVIEDPRRGAPATMVRSGHDRDLDDIVAMDAVRAAPYRFHLVRDRELASFAITRKRLLAGLGPQGRRGLEFFIAEEGANAAAYVVIDTTTERWTIDSCGDRDPSGARIGAILQVLVAREPSQHRPPITAWLPETLRPPQIEIVGAAPSRDVMMWRALSDRGRLAAPLRAQDILYWRGDAF